MSELQARKYATTEVVDSKRRQSLGWVVATLLPLTTGLSGCGFQPRGRRPLVFDTLYVEIAATSPLRNELRRTLRTSTQVVDSATAAQARLVILSEQREREIVGYSSSGRPREYQLRYRVGFKLLDTSGQELMAPQEILQRRDITTDDTITAAKEQEEQLLYRDMINDLVQQIVRKLAAYRPAEPQ